jgi:diguanylate cyclase (GGDEF)-like protein
MKRSASSLWERIRQRASTSLGNGLVPDQYRRMFLRKNYLLNASRTAMVGAVALVAVLAQGLGLLGGWLRVEEEHRTTAIMISALLAAALAGMITFYILCKKHIFRSMKVIRGINFFGVIGCMSTVVYVSVASYPSPESMIIYVIGLFSFAIFLYTTVWQSVIFYVSAHVAFITMMLVCVPLDGNLAQTLFFTTVSVLLAWVGSRMLYSARAGAFMSDVAQAELQHMSLTDPLLGISNRRKFDIAMQFSWNYCRREQKPISLAMIDIDYFKRYNDRFGHSRGDECLKQVTAAIGAMIHRESDELARVGGEELAFMLPLTPLEDAARIMEKARLAVAELKIENPDAPGGILTVSAGVAGTVPGAGRRITSPQELYQAADDALYNAKKQGRNRICLG